MRKRPASSGNRPRLREEGSESGRRSGKKPRGGGRPAGKPRRPSGGQHGRPAQRRKLPPPEAVVGGLQRLQKVLAAAGYGSRRQCEELITAGRVEVDRAVVTELGTRVDPAVQTVRVDGEKLPTPRLAYYAVNKPDGVITTNNDPAGRPRVIDLVPERDLRLFPVGRLDLHSEGLILVTNDGELANQLTHPRYGVSKTYRAIVAGEPSRETLEELTRGVRLAEGVARAERAEIVKRQGKSTALEIVLREGRNREIRRILAKVGHKVLRLTRLAVGPVRLGDLPPGTARPLSPAEVDDLRRTVRSGKKRPRNS